MPLTLRPTGLSGNPHRNDWLIREDGRRAEIRWFWSITVMGPARFRVRTGNRAATLEQANADF